ncbi:hypothetical protein T552_00778 [Pneumocystis carinii B80]|uniref:DNA repair protein rad9 n=1 Tax=Pneumocystis carinii (strain B80) TaxID=1408658 RepID=A0A0W4ZPM2_PNEC8|nr:hypothetical protein T552_00778 [Pneumocystis carinii B80]KTW30303.1 hypothetical protein T552_00778 [Pneumocystis carinii B80]
MNAVISGIRLKEFSKFLVCLSKIGDELSIEARKNNLLLSSINSTKSVFGLVTFDCEEFFEKYQYFPYEQSYEITSKNSQSLKCRVQIRFLLAIFKTRNLENRENKNVSVQKCELRIIRPNNTEREYRLIVRFLCKHGVLKTYKITYEQCQTMHALCNKSLCKNRWKIHSRILKEYLDHFSARAEELTLMSQNDKLLLTSFTEGLVYDKEILKQPIQTAILLDKRDFEEIYYEKETIITFPLKEFKAIVTLGDSMNVLLNAYFNLGGEPILFEFEREALSIRFIFATTSDNPQENLAPYNLNKSSNSNNLHMQSQINHHTNDHFSHNGTTLNNEINDSVMEDHEESMRDNEKSANSISKNILSINDAFKKDENTRHVSENAYYAEKKKNDIDDTEDSDDEVGPTQKETCIKSIFD